MENVYNYNGITDISKILSDLFYLMENEGDGKEVFERSRKFLQGTEFENIEFDIFMSSEELEDLIFDMLTEIENRIPEEFFVDVMDELDFEVFRAFYYEENFNKYPELMAVGMKKACEIGNSAFDELWEYADKDILIANMDKFEGRLENIPLNWWDRCFVEKFWKKLTPEEQTEHLDQVIDMIDNEKIGSYSKNDFKVLKLLMGTTSNLKEYTFPMIMDILSVLPLNEMDCLHVKTYLLDVFKDTSPEVQDGMFKSILDNISKINELYEDDNFAMSILLNAMTTVDESVLKNNAQLAFEKFDEIASDENRSIYENRIWEYRDLFPKNRDLSYIPVNIDKCLVDSKINFDETKEYLSFVLSRDRYALTNNAYVNHIYQALNTNMLDKYKLTPEQIEEIRALYELAEIGKNDVEPDMSKYEDKIISMEEMSEKDFGEFCNRLKVLKNLHGRIPEKYCDYIIKQKLTKNSLVDLNQERYEGIVGRAFEDKSSHILKAHGLGEYMIHVSKFAGTTRNAKTSSVGFCHEDGIIALSSECVNNLSLTNVFALDMVYHECRHALQDKHLAEGNFVNPKEYIMLKERIIREKRPEYYYKNYRYNSVEIDARLAGFRDTVKYLKSLGFTEREIMQGENKTLVNFKEYFRNKQMAEMEKYDTNTFLKKDKDDNEKSLNEMFSEVIREDPTILKDNPALAIEFNEDGTRKSRISVLSKFDDVLDEIRTDKSKVRSSNFRVYQEILKDYTGMDTKTVIEEVEDAANLQLKNKPFEKVLDRIVEKGGLMLFSESMANGEIEINPEDTDEERKKNFLRLKSGLEAYSKTYPNRDVSKKIEEELNRFNSLGKIEISEINVDTSIITDRTQSDDEWDR